MSQKSIREIHGKQMLHRWFKEKCAEVPIPKNMLLIDPTTTLDSLPQTYPWLLTSKLVAKPDQLIKRRGNSKLIHLNGDWASTKQWIEQHRGKSQQIERVKGDLTHFLVEEFVPHISSQEMYVCISSVRQGSLVYYCREGGVDVGDVDAKAEKYLVPVDQSLTEQLVQTHLLKEHIKDQQERKLLSHFIVSLFNFYTELHFAYLEINPIVVRDGQVFPLDFAAKVDQTADFLCADKWGKIDFPAPFGRAQTKEESFIAELDAKTGASLKLTVLNPNGRIWTMVAGGGASVVYADTISDLGFGEELSNYGEYSGDPSEALTFQYAKTVLELMTKSKHPKGNKILVIGGGIANFTNVAETFGGIVRAITLMQEKLRDTNVKIYVRRGGPNYQEGLQRMRECGEQCGIHMEVFGPETHITSIIPYALGLRASPVVGTYDSTSTVPTARMSPASPPPVSQQQHQQSLNPSPDRPSKKQKTNNGSASTTSTTTTSSRPAWQLLSDSSQAFVWGMQPGAVQNMLDFDHVCGRSTPSVVAMIYPFSGNHFQKFYWGAQEILIPVYEKTSEAMQRHPAADVLINFASFRSVYSSTTEALAFPQLKTIAIIAEGVPEQQTKSMIKIAHSKGINIIGPATVGGIKPGCFRIGNTGGMIDNIIASKLYRAGSVAYVSRSGGMSNELNNIVSRNSDGVCEGIAIGGDRFPGTTFLDHLLRYEQDPDVKILVLLGEVGGIEEYDICEAIKQKKITKPLIAWCIGTCAKIFPYEVQFGHAGALAHGNLETAQAKNEAMKAAGAHVPKSFDDFGTTIRSVYSDLVNKKVIIERPEPAVPTVPMDYSWARKLGLIRKPTSFVSTISDERGDELLYAGVPISSILKENLGVGGVISLLWFKRRLPAYATKFIEMVLIVTADHGPAVSGAHNTIITARAGKDLISSLVSGLVTIGPRFGGAIDGAAQQFSEAIDLGKKPKQFVEEMKNENKLIMGIGHRVKSADNADSRVKLLKEFVMTQFPTHPVLDYALDVEKITTAKKSNLILNLDGVIGTAFVDLLRGCGAFTPDEVKQYLEAGCLNALFVVGRSMGLVGHYIDQIRLKQPLYRHPWDDISYQDNDQNLP